MRYYYIKVNSSQYVGRNSNGQIQIVSKLKDALCYKEKNKDKLLNIIDSFPKKLKKENFKLTVLYYDDEDNRSLGVGVSSNVNKLVVPAISKVSSKDLMNAVNTISDCFEHKQDLIKQLVELQGKQNDILHYIELYKFSASEGYRLCKELQNIRKERREIKNQIEISRMCNNKNTLTLNNVIEKLEKINHRNYTPRYFNNLFKNNEGREND